MDQLLLIWSKFVCLSKYSKPSIAKFYRGYLILKDITISNIILQNPGLIMTLSELSVDSVTITNITRRTGSVAPFLISESDSIITLSNFEIDGVNFLLFVITNSYFQMYNTVLKNINADYHLIEAYTTQDIIIKNFTVFNSSSNYEENLVVFKNSVVESITDSKFSEIQFFALGFSNTVVKEFRNNTFDGMNRGIQIKLNSQVNISNVTIRNMKQNIKQGSLYFSDIKSSGSAISEF